MTDDPSMYYDGSLDAITYPPPRGRQPAPKPTEYFRMCPACNGSGQATPTEGAMSTNIERAAEVPTVEQITRMKDRGDRWLGAYYFNFETTGAESIDLILGAVALAGKLAHSTESWDDDDMDIEGSTPAELIQRCANAAAAGLLVTDEQQRLIRLGKAVEVTQGIVDTLTAGDTREIATATLDNIYAEAERGDG